MLTSGMPSAVLPAKVVGVTRLQNRMNFGT